MRASLAATLLALLTTLPQSSPDPLRRRAFWGASIGEPEGNAGATVRRVDPGGPAAKAGLEVGDRILKVNDTAVTDAEAWSRLDGALRAGDRPQLELVRKGAAARANVVLEAYPKETHPGLDTQYDVITMPNGTRLRAIVTKPQGAKERLPAILLSAWLSCDSVEIPPGATDGWHFFDRDLARDSGFVLMRVDKPGVGDSEGVCADTDYSTELAGYRAALEHLKRYDFVDPARLFVVGTSMGGATAPLVAQGQKVAGVAVWGSFAKTWLEHLLVLERKRLALAGDPPGVVNEKLRGYGELHALWLTHKLLPREALKRRPRLAPLWYDAPAHLYGRPAAFHHQAQELNLIAAWEKVEAPVLSLHGEYDWIMDRADHELLVDAVNRLRPGSARFESFPQTSHGFMKFASQLDAFKGGAKADYNADVARTVNAWLRERAGLPALAAASAATDVFAERIKPLLLQRCAPCHAPGGSMYGRMPFDDPRVVREHKDGVLRRLKDEEKKLLEEWAKAG